MQSTTEDQFLSAYDELADKLYRHCYFRVFSKERAEELVQDTFTKTWEYLAQGKKVDNMKAFLYRVANNLIIDNSRKKKEESLEALIEADRSQEPVTVTGQMEQEVLLKQILETVKDLPEHYKQVLLMRYVDDLEPREIADMLHMPVNNVSVTIHRAVEALKKKVNR